VLAQGPGAGAGLGFASSEGDAAGWQLMNESLGLRASFAMSPTGASGNTARQPRLAAPPRASPSGRRALRRPTFASGPRSSPSLATTPGPSPRALAGKSGPPARPRDSRSGIWPAGSGSTPARSAPGSRVRCDAPTRACGGSSSAGLPRQRDREALVRARGAGRSSRISGRTSGQ
jgi:hypothetical protein